MLSISFLMSIILRDVAEATLADFLKRHVICLYLSNAGNIKFSNGGIQQAVSAQAIRQSSTG